MLNVQNKNSSYFVEPCLSPFALEPKSREVSGWGAGTDSAWTDSEVKRSGFLERIHPTWPQLSAHMS